MRALYNSVVTQEDHMCVSFHWLDEYLLNRTSECDQCKQTKSNPDKTKLKETAYAT